MQIKIEAEPAPITIRLSETALIIIDMQKDFLLPGGYGESLGNEPKKLMNVVAPIKKILEIARAKQMLIIHTREGHLPDLSDCPPTKITRWPKGKRIGDQGPMGRILIRGEIGHEIIDALVPYKEEIVIDKPGKNAFYKTNLEGILRKNGIVNLFITGVTTDICCSATVSSANDRGFNALVISDCMASYDQDRHSFSLEIIKAQGGILGWVTNLDKITKAID